MARAVETVRAVPVPVGPPVEALAERPLVDEGPRGLVLAAVQRRAGLRAAASELAARAEDGQEWQMEADRFADGSEVGGVRRYSAVQTGWMPRRMAESWASDALDSGWRASVRGVRQGSGVTG
jgi:hypothetical protein